jgi:hypothetical protein
MPSFPLAPPKISSKNSFVIVLNKSAGAAAQQSKGSSKAAKSADKGTVPPWARKGHDTVDTNYEYDACASAEVPM